MNLKQEKKIRAATRDATLALLPVERMLFDAGLPLTAKHINLAIQSLGWEAAAKLASKKKGT